MEYTWRQFDGLDWFPHPRKIIFSLINMLRKWRFVSLMLRKDFMTHSGRNFYSWIFWQGPVSWNSWFPTSQAMDEVETKKSNEISNQNELRRLQRQLREASEAANDTETKDGRSSSLFGAESSRIIYILLSIALTIFSYCYHSFAMIYSTFCFIIWLWAIWHVFIAMMQYELIRVLCLPSHTFLLVSD